MKNSPEFEKVLLVNLNHRTRIMLLMPIILLTGILYVSSQIYFPSRKEGIVLREKEYNISGEKELIIYTPSYKKIRADTSSYVEKKGKVIAVLLPKNKGKDYKNIFMIKKRADFEELKGDLEIYPSQTLFHYLIKGL